MSGLEVAASALAFAGVAPKIIKVLSESRDVWEQVKDVPEELQWLHDTLQDYEKALALVDEQLQQDEEFLKGAIDGQTRANLNKAREAQANLQLWVAGFKQRVASGKGIGQKTSSLKFVRKKNKLKGLEKKLERHLDLLKLSLQTHQHAVNRLMANPKVIAVMVRKEIQFHIQQTGLPLSPAKPPITESLASNYTDQPIVRMKPLSDRDAYKTSYGTSTLGRVATQYSKQSGVWQGTVQLPKWLSSKVFEMQTIYGMSSRAFHFRVYNEVPKNSEIILKVADGDVSAVKELLSSRKASPFDKDPTGISLLYYATRNRRYDMCAFLLSLGLENEVKYNTPVSGRNCPISQLVYKLRRTTDNTPHEDWYRISGLFRPHLEDPTRVAMERIFDFIHEWAVDNSYLFIMIDYFIPDYFGPNSSRRFEAMRLGAFHVSSAPAFQKLLSRDCSVRETDVSQSSQQKLSLLHSSAIAFGIRYADELLPYKRLEVPWHLYTDDWSHFARNVASVMKQDELHPVETVIPWDVYLVPVWKGTPLMSALGGALCHLSPDSLYHWDTILQGILQQWAQILAEAGVDIVEYGSKEASMLRADSFAGRGTFDADATEISRPYIRHVMSTSGKTLRVQGTEFNGWNMSHWVPIRILDIKFGPQPRDWRLVWAPEYEYMARQFWETLETEMRTMPGCWVD